MIPILLMILAAPPESRPGVTTVRMSVQPTAAPKPALKYQLLPEVRELQAGNAAHWYFRCFMEQRNFFFNKESCRPAGELSDPAARPASRPEPQGIRRIGTHAGRLGRAARLRRLASSGPCEE